MKFNLSKKLLALLLLFVFFLGNPASVLAVASWTTVDDLNIRRRSHTATLLTSGKVLVAGTEPQAVGTETYDPTTGNWTFAGTLNFPRHSHTSHLVTISGGDTRIIAIGGTDSSGTLDKVESFNPTTSIWSNVSSLINRRTLHASVILNDGTVLVTGGSGIGQWMNHVEQYDPVENTWSAKTTMNIGRLNHTATLLNDGRVLITGGSGSTGTLSSAEIYDPASNSWTNVTSMNVVRTGHRATLLPNGKVLVSSGANSFATAYNTAEVYDPATNIWTNTPTLNYQHRNNHTATLITLSDGITQNVLVTGGFFSSGAELYDYINNTWNITSSMNVARTHHTATLLNDGTVLVAGGLTHAGNTASSEIYTPSDVDPTLTPTPTPTPTPAKTPIVLIPGMAGSELETAEEVEWSENNGHDGIFSRTYPADELVWLNLFEALKPGDDDYFDILRMDIDGQTNQANLVRNDTFVSLAYGSFIDFFTDNGYELNQTLFLFPYDWRMDVGLTASDLYQKIENIKTQTGATKVDIVAHSMGGLVARNYIADSGAAQNVRKLFTIATPHLGSPEYIKNLMYGGCLSKDPFKKPICFGVSPSEVKDVVQNMISGFELAPSLSYFTFYSGEDNLHPLPFRDDRDIDNNSVTGPLSYSQIKTLLTNLQYNTSLFGPSEVFHNLDNALINTNGVEVTNIVGSGLSTLGQIIEKYSTTFLGIKIPKKDRITINGDETVPLFSASLSDAAKNISFLGNANVFYTKQEHGNLAFSGPALNLVNNILNDITELPDGVSDQPYSLNGTQLSVHSPVDIHVYDSQGRHIGPTNNGDAEADIPGSSYDTLDDAKFIWLPDDDIYDIEFEATDEGSFDFKIRKFENDLNTQTILYKDVPLTNSTKANAVFDTRSSQPPVLKLDENGDKIVDSNIDNFSVLEGDTNYDHNPPAISLDVSPKTIWSSNNKMVDVALTGTIIDENPYVTKILVEDEYNLIEPSTATYYETEINQTIQLEASRKGDDKDGRMYTIKVLTTDLADNTSFASFEVIVPHDQRE